jgi:ATP-binding cassette, subfamily B, bacterial PglK
LKTFFTTYKKVFEILPENFKKKFFFIQILILVTSVVDILGLASFIPIISSISDESIINESSLFQTIKTYFSIEKNEHLILIMLLCAFVFFIIRFLFIIISFWIQNKFVFDLSEYVGKKTYEYYLHTNFEDFNKREAGKIVRDLNFNSMAFSKNIVLPLLTISNEILSIVIIIAGIIIYDYKIFFLIVLTMFPITYLFNFLVKDKMKHYGLEQNRISPLLFDSIIRSVHGYIDVKLKNKENLLIKEYTSIYNTLKGIQIKTSVANIIPAKLIELSTVAGLLVIFIYNIVINDNLGSVISVIVLYSAAAYKISPSISKILPSLMNLDQYQYVFKVYHISLKFIKDNIRDEKLEFNDFFELKNISFKYSNTNKMIIEDFNINIKKGETIGLIGKSGGGKSTLVKIICGFLEPTKGEIIVDGVTLTREKLRSWMDKISFVQQAPFIEKGTLMTNVAFLDKNPDENKVLEALEKACLIDLLGSKKPSDFFITEDGKNLSGGQKQRVILARAIYNNSKIIILDEATSALDDETEKSIIETIQNLKKEGITLIIIAHRLTTLEHADKVIEI